MLLSARPSRPNDRPTGTLKGYAAASRGALPSPTEAAAPRAAKRFQRWIAQLKERRERRRPRRQHQDAAAGVAGFSATFLISAVVFTVASPTASLALFASVAAP